VRLATFAARAEAEPRLGNTPYTPKTAATEAQNVGNAEIDEMLVDFLKKRPARDIAEFMQNLVRTDNYKLWVERATIALQIRLAEDAANTADNLTHNRRQR
jgi:hypothetical protein